MMLDRLTVEKTIFNLKYGVYWLRFFSILLAITEHLKLVNGRLTVKLVNSGFFSSSVLLALDSDGANFFVLSSEIF